MKTKLDFDTHARVKFIISSVPFGTSKLFVLHVDSIIIAYMRVDIEDTHGKPEWKLSLVAHRKRYVFELWNFKRKLIKYNFLLRYCFEKNI